MTPNATSANAPFTAKVTPGTPFAANAEKINPNNPVVLNLANISTRLIAPNASALRSGSHICSMVPFAALPAPAAKGTTAAK
ncbi:hypothetical protein LTR95_010061, partial [Oleoguttula sp. CCFEE 5521]